MNTRTYSSLEAFLAHYRALFAAARTRRGAAALSAEERDLLAAMRETIGSLGTLGEMALADTGADPAIARRRQRAERSLRRILAEQGILQG